MKKTLLKTAALIALANAAPSLATAQEAPAAENEETRVEALRGNLDAFWGGRNLDAFWGRNLDAFFGRNLDAFWGRNLDAFGGNLDAFDGDIDQLRGNLDAFWGTRNLDAFWGRNLDAFGNLDAFYGHLDAFYGNLDAFYGNLDAFWGNLDAFGEDWTTFDADLQSVLDSAEAAFNASALTVGLDFNAEIVDALLAKYCLNEDEFTAAGGFDRTHYAMFLIELNDRLMAFSGHDHVDHWMATASWTPAVSEAAGSGFGVRIGVLDTQLNDVAMFDGKLHKAGGYFVEGQDHGAAVLSVLGAAHDGVGAMGVAPDATVSFYNPFDATFSASWDDVKAGVIELASNNASVINMSLGVSGNVFHQDWREVFADADVASKAADVLFVKAAGNDGVQQTTDIEWGLDAHERLLIVGSVDPTGEISSFSNTPGEACLLTDGVCIEENKLKYRFLVAPGELILTSDNEGGLTRVSGTSFAAPIVSGAVALLQSRWNWLAQNPEETAEILLRSATDLGDEGVDATYGWGLLNIEASQQPLDPSALYVRNIEGAVTLEASGLTLATKSMVGNRTKVIVFEDIGDTFRDFEVEVVEIDAIDDPNAALSASVETDLSQQLNTISSGGKGGKGFAAFADSPTLGGFAMGDGVWTASFAATARDPREIDRADALPFEVGARVENAVTGVSVSFGQGEGALALSSGGAFTLSSDHDRMTGGANPILGLASGGAYAGVSAPVIGGLSVSAGYTMDADAHEYVDGATGETRDVLNGLADYRASATTVGLSYAVASSVTMRVDYTQLTEDAGLLGGQGAGAFNFEGGATTDATTVGANAELTRGLMVSASATVAKTRATDFASSIFSVGDEGLTSTAFQVAATKLGVFGDNDRARLSFAQPLHAEAGALTITAEEVVNRETGERALVSRDAELADARRYVAEGNYATDILGGRATVSGFAQVEMNSRAVTGEQTSVAGGARFQLRF